MSDGKLMLQGQAPDGFLFACVDPDSRYCQPQVCAFKFSASLAPFTSEEAARAALNSAGAVIIKEAGR